MKHSNNQCIKKYIPAWAQVFVTVWYAFVANIVALFLYSILIVIIVFNDGYGLTDSLLSPILNFIFWLVFFLETIPVSTLFLSILHYFKVAEYCIYSKTFVAIESIVMMIFTYLYYSHFNHIVGRFCFFTAVFVVLISILLIFKYVFRNKYEMMRNNFTDHYIIDYKESDYYIPKEYVIVFLILILWIVISTYLSPN